MNELKIFNNEEFGNVRIVLINENEWFVANDIAKALGYSDCPKAIRTHCKGVAETSIPSNGGNQVAKIIKESDIYRLIVKSKLPSAQKFEKWVMEEVLPSIRKNGAYMTEQTLEKALTSPDFLIQLATQLKSEQEARKLAETKLEEAKPKLEFANSVEATGKAISMGDMAKLLKKNGFDIGRNRLYEYLRDFKVLMSGSNKNIPYQKYMEWFEVTESVKFGKLCVTTLVLPKGQIGIVNHIKNNMEF